MVKHGSEKEWTTWLFDLGPEDLLWFCPWYGIQRFMIKSDGYKMVYLVGLSMTTFYQATRVMRQMGHSQGIPPDGPIF